jgi:hypothetical protein
MVDIVDLRNLVAEAEGTTDAKASQENFASGYDVPFAYGQYLQPSKPISQMTFQELGDFQRRQVNATKGTFDNTNLGTGAVGRYQFIGPTLENLKNRLGYKDTDVFSPEVQDRLFDALMEEQGLQKLLAGLITPEKFQEKLSSQFASIPKPGTETGTYKGQRTGVTSDRVSAVLSSMQADTQTDQMLSGEQPEDTFRSEDDTVPSDTGVATGDQAEEEPGFLDTVGEYVGDAYDTVSEYAGETVDTLEGVAESVGDKLRRLLGLEEEQQSSSSNDTPPLPTPRPGRTDTPPLPTPRPSQTKTPSFNVADAARDVYSLATTGGSRAPARKLRDMVAQQLGVYESSQEATSEAKKYGLNEREVDTLRHILGAGLLKYIGKDSTQPLLQGTELFEKIQIYAQRLLDSNSEDKYRKSYYDQSIEEANIDIVNYQVGAALAKQFETKDDFIRHAVELVKELGKGKNPVVVDKTPTLFGVVDTELTPELSTGVIYPPEELEIRNLIYNPDKRTLILQSPPPVEDYGFVEPAPGSNLEDQGPAVLEKAEGGSVEKEVEFVKEDDDDDDVPDPPPGATPEEVADDIPAYLSTGEYVLPANVVRYIGLKNITGMHQRALSELQQMEDLDIIENVDENGYVEEDDDEMDYMEPEEAGVVEIVVAEHHPKGLMAMGFAEGGMINSDSSMEEGQVLPTSDIFSEGVYAQANINRSVDSEDVVESDKVITAPVAFSSAPGKTAYLAYITPEEAASLRQAKQGFSSEGNGQEVSDGQYQHLGPKGLMSFNGTAGTGVGGTAGGYGAGDVGSGSGKGASSSSGAGDEDDATDPGAAKAEQDESPIGGVVGAINEFMGFDPTHGYAGKGVTDPTTGEVYGPGGLASVSRSYTEKDVRDPKSVASAVGMGLGSIAGGLAGIGQAAVNAAVAAGVDVQEASTNDIGGGSQEFPEEKKADTDSTKTTDTDPLSDYIYVPGVGYRRRVKRVKPLSKLKAGGYVSKKGIMARGYSEGGMINSDSSFEEGQVLPTSDIFSEGVYAQVNIDRSVDSENVVESDKVITAPIAFSSAPGKTAYLAYITPEEAASLRQAKQGFSSEGNGLEVSDGQYQHLGPKGLMSFNGDDGGGVGGTAGGYGAGDVGAAASDPGPGDGHGGGASEFVEDLEPEDVEEEKPTDPYEGYTYVKGIGYVPTSRRATSIESASLALSSIFTPGFLGTIGLMGDPNKEL